MEGGKSPKNTRALTPPTSKNKLSKVFGSDTFKRPVAWSGVAPVAFWYVWNASVASKINVVPTISINFKYKTPAK